MERTELIDDLNWRYSEGATKQHQTGSASDEYVRNTMIDGITGAESVTAVADI